MPLDVATTGEESDGGSTDADDTAAGSGDERRSGCGTGGEAVTCDAADGDDRLATGTAAETVAGRTA